MTDRQIGPLVTVTYSCRWCVYCLNSYYAVQGDSGFDVSCGHQDAPEQNTIGDSKWNTPEWCPERKPERA